MTTLAAFGEFANAVAELHANTTAIGCSVRPEPGAQEEPNCNGRVCGDSQTMRMSSGYTPKQKRWLFGRATAMLWQNLENR